MSVVRWFMALFAGLIVAFLAPLLWAGVSGVIGALLDVAGVHVAASTFLAASPVFAVFGFVGGVWWVMSS